MSMEVILLIVSLSFFGLGWSLRGMIAIKRGEKKTTYWRSLP